MPQQYISHGFPRLDLTALNRSFPFADRCFFLRRQGLVVLWRVREREQNGIGCMLIEEALGSLKLIFWNAIDEEMKALSGRCLHAIILLRIPRNTMHQDLRHVLR